MPIRENSFINDFMTGRSSSVGNKGQKGSRGPRGSRGASVPAWRSKLITQDEKDEKQTGSKTGRGKSCIWSKDAPTKRCARRLSSSMVGLAGGSPQYVELRGPDRTREQRCLDEITMKLEMGSVDDLWTIYVQSSAWHQDDGAKWPVQNEVFVKVRKRITFLLKQKMKKALEKDDVGEMEAAIRAADGKVQILATQGNEQFYEMDKIFERLEMKQEEQRRVMKGLKDSSTPAMAFHDKDAARSSLHEAIETKDIETIRTAIQKCMEAQVDVTDAAKHVAITSKYFAPEGEREKSLFPLNCFKGEGRCVHIVNLGPEMDLNVLARHGEVAGVKVKFYTDPNQVLVGKENRKTSTHKATTAVHTLHGSDHEHACEVTENPHLHTIILISGPEPARLEGDTDNLTKLLKFNKAGGALGIIASGNRGGHHFSLIRDANILLQVFGLDKMWGHDAAARVLSKQSATGSSGFNASHPLFSQIKHLDEGFSITGLDDMYLKRGFSELVRSSNGKLLACIKEPSASFSGDGSGPIFISGSATQLLCSKEAEGVETWINNVILYMALRQADVAEVYKP
mmetsp:Transcript_72882/g.189244  ORF Transcript_72882/g.189244 Transcript_72882/m.189244 type:complete len:569 (-) Transcript_72882:267-1973(-)